MTKSKFTVREWVEPPDGWFVFGTHSASDPVPDLEFSDATDPEDGLPLFERPIESTRTDVPR